MSASADLFATAPTATTAHAPASGVVKIVVYGEPAPQGSKKFVGFTKPKPGEARGHAIMKESSDKVAPWREDVNRAGRAVMDGRAPIDGPIIARMVFTVRKPASAPKTRRTYPCVKPDLSKLLRSTEDALKTAGVIADDSRIVEYSRAAKVFPLEDPEALEALGVRIEIRRLGS